MILDYLKYSQTVLKRLFILIHLLQILAPSEGDFQGHGLLSTKQSVS